MTTPSPDTAADAGADAGADARADARANARANTPADAHLPAGPIVLDGAQTRDALDIAALMPLVRRALVAIARHDVSAPPRSATVSGAGLLGAMLAHVPGLGTAGKLISVFPRPGEPGRSTHRGVVMLIDDTTGEPLALMDAEPISALRTAAAATVAMEALARPGSRRFAVIGAGAQARAQLELLTAVGPADALIAVVSRDLGRATRAAEMHPSASAVRSVEEAVDGADVVLSCTDATSPVVKRSWLAPGVHLSSVGGSHGPEIDAETVDDGGVFVEWHGAVTEPPPVGAHELQGMEATRVTDIGAVLDGVHPGRRSAGEITIFKSTGHAALDVAAAVAVWARVPPVESEHR